MFYWLIPYLVSYNASDIGDWKYGPEHLFQVNVTTTTLIGNETWRFYVDMFISCRPLNSSFNQCRVESAKLDDYKILPSSDNDSVKSESSEKLQMDNVIFQIEFDKSGPRNVTFLNTDGYFRQNMIRSIVDQFNIGTDLSDKIPGKNYFFDEKSVNGICETSFNVQQTKWPHREDVISPIEKFNFDVPAFSREVGWRRDKNLPIVIEKRRKMNDCSVKNHYFFGNANEDGYYFKPSLLTEHNITRSETTIYLGKTGFRSYTNYEGTMEIKTGGTPSDDYRVAEPSKSMINETIRIKLVAIRPANEKL